MSIAPAPVDPITATPALLRPNWFGFTAIVLAGAGAFLAMIPATSGWAWILLLPATVLAVIGLVKKGLGRGAAIAAAVVAPIAMVISVVVLTASATTGAGTLNSSADNVPGAQEATTTITSTPGPTKTPAETNAPEPSSSPQPALPAKPPVEPAPSDAPVAEAPRRGLVGETISYEDGISLTVSSMRCGLASVGTGYLTSTPMGEFCEVKFTMFNGTNYGDSFYGGQFSGTIGEAYYSASSGVDGSVSSYVHMNPGLGIDCVSYFDVPAGKSLDTFTFNRYVSGDVGLTIEFP